MTLELVAPDEAATRAIGAAFAHALVPGTIVHLRGDLGAGKTTLARALVQSLVPGTRVKSPTYTLIESYPEASPPVHHLDLYRIADPEELELLDLRELVAAGGVVLIEWPERGGAAVPSADLEVALAAQGDMRRLTVAAATPRGRAVVDAARARLGPAQTSNG